MDDVHISLAHNVYDVNMRSGYHHGNLPSALVDEAVRAIRDGREPTLRSLAAALGVSPSAAYRHFEDHAHLLDAAAARWLDELGQAMRRALETDPDGAPLAIVTRVYLDHALADPALFRLASGVHGFGRAGGVLGSGPEGPAPQQVFQAAAPGRSAEFAWIATHGLAVLAVDGPYDREGAERLLPELLGALGLTSRG